MSNPSRQPEPHVHRLADAPWSEAAAYLRDHTDQAVAVVPVGAVEAHGMHAPLGTDIFIAETIANRLAVAVDGVVAPAIPFGCLDLGYGFDAPAGSISVDSQTLIGLCTDVGSELGRHGFDPVVFVNGHGPNTSPLAIAAFNIRRRAGVQVGVIDWWTAARDAVVDIKGFGYGNHADEIETSVLLATNGAALVDLDAAVANSPTLEGLTDDEKVVYLKKLTFTHTFDQRWVGDSNNMGNPRAATRDKGDRIIAETVALGIQLVAALRQQTKNQPREEQ